MSNLSATEFEVAELIVDSLNLEDITADGIDPHEPLFRDGLGLDSIDALELSLAIKQKYGIQLRAEDENVDEIFTSLATLTDYIKKNS